jgi:hypothetical protein
MRLLGIAALWAVVAAGAGAERYNVAASAGNDGDSHVDNDDPDAFAEFVREDVVLGGAEFYEASANAAGGSLQASASRSGSLAPLAVTTGAAANLEETIHFTDLPPNPNDTVSIKATLGIAVGATAAVGFANASGSVTLRGPAGECTASTSAVAGSGTTSNESCQDGAGETGSGAVTLILTRTQLESSGGDVDILANVSAQLENFGGLEASAFASGGAGLSRGGAPVPGTIHIDIDPPLAHAYTGSQTFFLVPEPGAPWLLASGAAVLSLAARSRRRR